MGLGEEHSLASTLKVKIKGVGQLHSRKSTGMLTERDYSRKVILKGRSSADTTVADIMTTDLPHVSPFDTIDQCMQLMSDKHIRYLPVFDNGQLAGIISMSDVVNAIIANQKDTISHLENYINSAV